VGQDVVGVLGIVTAVGRDHFYFQDAIGDDDDATSDAIMVVLDDQIIMDGLAVGDEVAVNGSVEEYVSLNEPDTSFPITRLIRSSHSILTRNNPLPAPILIGNGGRLLPTELLADGLSFWSALESMRVTLLAPLTCVAPTNEDGTVFAVMNNAVLSPRGTLTIGEKDFNPERIQIQTTADASASTSTVRVDVGTTLSNVTGIVRYVSAAFFFLYKSSSSSFFSRALSLNTRFSPQLRPR
jgi:hypothetical protein